MSNVMIGPFGNLAERGTCGEFTKPVRVRVAEESSGS